MARDTGRTQGGNSNTDQDAAQEDRSVRQTPDDVMAPLPGQPFSFDREGALPFVATHDPQSGRELTDGERDVFANNIAEAARANVSWRATRPVTEQLAMMATPVVGAPRADSEG